MVKTLALPTIGLVMIIAALCQTTTHPKSALAKRPTATIPQQPFEFHGDALGEEWGDFEKRHRDTGTTCWGSDAAMTLHNLKDPFPDITRLAKVQPGLSTESRDTGILYCEVKGDKQTLLGSQVDSKFEFFADKLFKITAFRMTPAPEEQQLYSSIKDAYRSKYGPPASDEIKTYQNGFGAIFYGGTAAWVNSTGSHMLIVMQGAGGDSITVQFVDTESTKKQEKPIKKGDL